MTVVLFLVIGAGALTAASTETVAASSIDDAVSQVWPVTQCLAENAPVEIEALLAKPRWGAGETRGLVRLAERHAGCGRIAPESIDLDRGTIRGVVAGSVFVAKHKSGEMPDYANAPSRVELERSFAAPDPRTMSGRKFWEAVHDLTTDPLLGECALSKSPSGVLKFLGSAPRSEEESASLRDLSQAMNSCLFEKNGTQVRYSRTRLRRIFGEAGLELDYRVSVGSEVRH